MPKYRNPLYIQASEYLGGFYAETMSARELLELENNLFQELEYELSLVTRQIWRLVDQINVLDHMGSRIDWNDKSEFHRYLALLKIYCRLARVKCRLLRTHHKIMSESNKRNDLHLFAFQQSPPPALGINALLPAPNGSSQKTTFFYSKLFRKNMDLTDDQWNIVKDLVPQKIVQGAGRPPQDTRSVLNGIFWKLRTGASWNDLPLEYPSHQTCYRYYTEWVRAGLLDNVVNMLVIHLKQSGFDLLTALHNNDIELIKMAKQTHIRFAPRWQDTWQSSTALLLLQIFIHKKRKLGEPFQKIAQSYPLIY